MYRRLALVLLLSLSILPLALSQSKEPTFYHMYADMGLASDKTTTVFQDYLGFIWFGTEEGLSKSVDYGYFDTYKNDRKDSTTLSNDYVNIIFEDSKKRLWVGTRDGLNIYNRELNNFSRVEIAHRNKYGGRASIYDIKQDETGDLWILCNDHVVRVDGESLQEKYLYKASDETKQEVRITSFTFFKSKVIAGTPRGLFELVGKEFKPTAWIEGNYVINMLPIGNELWVATAASGVVRYDYTRESRSVLNVSSKQTPLTSNHVNHLYKTLDDKVWVSTIDGITIIDLATEESQFIKSVWGGTSALSDKMVRQVYQDRQGAIWATTASGGVNFSHVADNLFDYFGQSTEDGTENDLMDWSVFSLFNHKGKSWIGTRKGLSSLDDKTGKFKHYPMDKGLAENVTSILSIDNCTDDNLWLGTNNGLLSWRVATGTYKQILPDVLNGVKINSVLVDNEDVAWLGTEEQGVLLYSTIANVVTPLDILVEGHKLDYLPSVKAISRLKNGALLVATEKGLFQYKNGRLEKVSVSVKEGDSLDDIPINTIYESEKYGVLLATQQDGLLVLNEQLKLDMVVDKKVKIVSNDVRSVVEDDDQTLWLSTDAGLTRLKLDLEDSTKTSVKNYDISDGLQSDRFSQRAGIRAGNGKILMGGLAGITRFDPVNIKDFKIPHELNIVALSIDGKKVKVGDKESPLSKDISLIDRVDLGCEQNTFSLQFSASDMLRPGDVEYRYKLGGYHDDWVILDENDDSNATFENIPGGRDYELVVQSKGRFTDWSEEKKLVVSIQPHFYETVIFKVLVGLLFLGLIFLIFWYRNKRIVRKQKELESLVEARSVELTEEITERRKAEEKLQVALSEAEQANEIKSRFLANMSHEIRTPLNGIMGLTQLSLETDSKEEQEDILGTLATSAKSLKVIVDDILDIAKIEAGTMDFASEVFSIKDLLDEVIASFRTVVDDKKLYLKKWVLPTIPEMVLGDVDRVRQVLVNLVSNAVKFTHTGGVTILAEGLDQGGDQIEIWFTVTDTGIGMPETQLNRIFESFTQVDSGDTRAYGGTGLGLSICKELVEKMGGEIWAESDEDSGSIFRFYIKAEEVFEEDYEEVDLEEELEQELPEDVVQSALKCILLVEDNPTNQKVASKMLERNSIEVICANNGVEGLRLIQEKNFDLVLMDLQMPEMDGYETTHNIRRLETEKSKIPIIALTAAAMVGEREKCLEAGMNDYLSKPVDYNLLIKTVNKYLNPDLEEQRL